MLPTDAPDLTTLDLLESVAELGSLGQAGARHHLSQPAVGMRMSALEQRLGLVLLEREPSGTRLTLTGSEVVAAARRVLEEMGTFMALVEALRADVRSRLRVAASLTVAEHLLPGWIGALHGDAPEVALSLEVTNSTRVVQAVQTGRVDLGFVEGHEHDVPELSTLEVGRDRLAVVVRPDHPWARHASVLTAQELAGAELIVREEGSGTREVIEDALQPFGGLRTRLELGSSAALLAAARAGEGPAVLSALAAAEDLATGRLVQVAVAGLDLSRSLRAIWATRRGLGPLARRLLAAAARSAKGPPDGGAQKHTL